MEDTMDCYALNDPTFLATIVYIEVKDLGFKAPRPCSALGITAVKIELTHRGYGATAASLRQYTPLVLKGRSTIPSRYR
jgi:hypothetical protein